MFTYIFPFMQRLIKSRTMHLAKLWQQKVHNAWLSCIWMLYGILSAIKTEVMSSEQQEKWRIISMVLSISLFWWIVILCITIIAWIFEASFRINKDAQEKIAQLEKIDRNDIAHILHGFFFGDEFIYKSEIARCNPWEYKTRYEFEGLRNNWTPVSVPAPKKSLAKIKFHLLNGHPQGQKDFFVLDQNGEFHIDIYSDTYVLLDSKSCFYFKLTYSDDYEITEAVSLRIEVESWKK